MSVVNNTGINHFPREVQDLFDLNPRFKEKFHWQTFSEELEKMSEEIKKISSGKLYGVETVSVKISPAETKIIWLEIFQSEEEGSNPSEAKKISYIFNNGLIVQKKYKVVDVYDSSKVLRNGSINVPVEEQTELTSGIVGGFLFLARKC